MEIIADGATAKGLENYLNGIPPEKSEFDAALDALCNDLMDENYRDAIDAKENVRAIYARDRK